MYQSKWADPAPRTSSESSTPQQTSTPKATARPQPPPASTTPRGSSNQIHSSRWASPPTTATSKPESSAAPNPSLTESQNSTTPPTTSNDPEPPATASPPAVMTSPPQPETSAAPERPTSQGTTTSRPSSSHVLSAAAASFAPASPAAPPPDVSTFDEFAQTGAQQDDLFDDVVPVEESMQTRPPDDLFGDDFTPVEEPVVEQPAPQPMRARNEDGRGRGRGRGRGGRKESQGHGQGQREQKEQNNEDAQTQIQAPENAPTGPRREAPAAVRGNRQATGGVRKPKLTEDELAEKMTNIALKNASLTAAHARAEADAAHFAEREEHAKVKAAVKAKEERRDRQQMMGEREKNRMRKLKAAEGREWDMEKNEDDFSKGGVRDKKGGFAGDQKEYSDGREYLYKEPRGGRGGSVPGRGGGAGRGGKAPSAPPKQEDFPALPATSKAFMDVPKDNGDPGKSWADQVESSQAG